MDLLYFFINIVRYNISDKKEMSIKIKKQVELKQKSNRNKQDPKIRYLCFKLKKLNYEDKLSNIKTTYHSIQYKNLKKEIRKLQRLNLSNKEKKKALKLETLMNCDKNKFWKTIKYFRKKVTPLKQTNDSIDDYAKYYSNLFSHDDRPSNKNQLEIEKYVDEHYNSIKNVQFNEETFTYHGIERILKNLKIGKAIGVDFLSNEMFKYGVCNNLILLLKIILFLI